MLTKPSIRGHQWASAFTIHLSSPRPLVPPNPPEECPRNPQSASRTAGDGYWRFTCPNPGGGRFVAGAGSEPEVALSHLHKLPSLWMSGCSKHSSLCNNQLLSYRGLVGQQRGFPAQGQLRWVPVEPSCTRDANLVSAGPGGHRSHTFGRSAGSSSEIRPTELISIPHPLQSPGMDGLVLRIIC